MKADGIPRLLRSLVLRRMDLPMEDLVLKRPEELKEPILAKGWSVVMFLLETDPGSAREFFEDAGQEKPKKRGEAERALAKNFRDFKTWKDLDAAWRSWVLDVYRP